MNEAYLYAKYALTDKVSAGAGIRKNLTNTQARNYLSKQINARYAISEQHYLNALVSENNSYARNKYNAFRPVRTQRWALDYTFESDGSKRSMAVYQKREEYGKFTQKSTGAELYFIRIFRKWQFELSYSTNFGRVFPDSTVRYPSDHNLPFFIKSTVQWELPFLTMGTTLNFRPFTPVPYGRKHSQAAVFEPVYRAHNSQVLPNYFRADLLLSKYLVSRKNDKAWTFNLTIGNIFDTENVRSYSYNFDYNMAKPTTFQRRTLYTGLVYSFK